LHFVFVAKLLGLLIVCKMYLAGWIPNKVILFSNYGFTEPAITRAKLRGIELLEPKTVGEPIKPIPHIVGMGYLGQMIVQIVGGGPQYIQMALNPDDYIIVKGSQEISFQQNFFRIVVSQLRQISNKSLYSDLSSLTVEDKNVLYELKDKKRVRYNADFEINLSIKWDYFFENLPTGILFHINSGETKFVCLQENSFAILNKVLLSSSKINYEQREECIKQVVEKSTEHLLHLCMVDPDRLKTHPEHPILVPV